ncbi:hypothetical protein FRB90_009787, partial [Tulasnella sp. 427]
QGPIAAKLACIEQAHEADINSVDWLSAEGDRRLLASASDDGTVKIWKLFDK